MCVCVCVCVYLQWVCVCACVYACVCVCVCVKVAGTMRACNQRERPAPGLTGLGVKLKGRGGNLLERPFRGLIGFVRPRASLPLAPPPLSPRL